VGDDRDVDLGLPVAWRLAQAMGGELRAELGSAGSLELVLSLPR
jgi:hypothetical protein